MKGLFLGLVLCNIVSNCGPEKKKQLSSIAVSVIGDQTDPHALLPQTDPILRLYDCDHNPDAALHFRLRVITDKVHTPVYRSNLRDAASMEHENIHDDPQFRPRVIDAFYKRIKKLINNYTLSDTMTPLSNSECLRTISDELGFLSRESCDKTYLIIYSDLQEKSDLFNCYTPKNQTALENTENMVKQFDRLKLFPESIDGITVVFAYAPITRQEDQRFRKMANIYKALLESKGAKCFIQASNNLSDISVNN